MSTRTTKNKTDSFSLATGLEGANIPDFDLPSCTIEDVDRSLFNLFDRDLPFIYEHKGGSRRAPVIFASGERFATLRRKQPLRDKAGALILPLISIMRSSISQKADKGSGINQTVPLTIRKRLSQKDPIYQRLLNKMGLVNSDDLPSKNSLESTDKNATPGRIATRRENVSLYSTNGMGVELTKNMWEIIEIPPPKFFTVTYTVTLWTQYVKQMNDMITAMMSLYQSYEQKTFQLESDKGYWFVGYVEDTVNSDSNFDEFTDEERIVRYSFDVVVQGYIINPDYPGSQKTLRRFISAPEISFDAVITNKNIKSNSPNGIPSGDPNSYIKEDLRTIDEPLPGQFQRDAASDSRQVYENKKGSQSTMKASGEHVVGGAISDDNRTTLVELQIDPMTGKSVEKVFHLKTRTNRQGETVIREILI